MANDTLINLDNKLLDLLNSAHLLVGTINEEKRVGTIEERLSSRLKQLEANECMHEAVIAESAIQEKFSNINVRERFVEKCLELLGSLETILINIIDIKENKKTNEPELLGIRDMSLVHTMLEIVISWGIYPCLMSGVGIPISRRTRSRYFQQEFSNNSQNDDANESIKKLDPQSRYIYLFKLMQSLIKIICSSSLKPIIFTTVSSIIQTRHLTDVYAALLQLAYGPLPANDKLDVSTNNKLAMSDQSEIEKQGYGNFVLMRKECVAMFGKLFEREDSFRSLEALTMLLGSPLHPAPKWFKNVCGRFLTQILLRPNGVKDVMSFMIGGDNEVGLSQFETVSRLILSVPTQTKSTEDYFSIICPQLLNLLQSTSTLPSLKPNIDDATLPIVKLVAFTVIRMADKFPAITKKFIISNIFGTLWKWWGLTPEDAQSFQHCDSSTDLDPLIIDEQSLQSTITMTHHILIGSEPIPGLLQMFLEDSVAPLYYLYSFTCSSKSFLKNVVLDILLAYFKILNISEGVEGLKEILLRKTKRKVAPNIGDVGEIYFAPGASAGVVMRLRMIALNSSSTETSIDVNIFVDFLK
ncbi:584_t:CDS:2, partial [Scutellospora calospora]